VKALGFLGCQVRRTTRFVSFGELVMSSSKVEYVGAINDNLRSSALASDAVT